MKPEIKEKITATNQKYLKKFLTEEAPAKLESQLEHMDWSYLDMIHNKEQQRGTFSPLAAMELSEIEANKDKYLATGLDAVKNGKVGAILLAGGQGTSRWPSAPSRHPMTSPRPDLGVTCTGRRI